MRFGKAAAMASAAMAAVGSGLASIVPDRERDPGRSGGFSGRYMRGHNALNSGSIAKANRHTGGPHEHSRVIARANRAKFRITRNRARRAFAALNVPMRPAGSKPTRAVSHGITRRGNRVAL